MIDRGKRVKDEKQRFSGRREWGVVTSHCCLPRSRLSGKMNVSGLLLPAVLLASSISSRLPTGVHKLQAPRLLPFVADEEDK